VKETAWGARSLLLRPLVLALALAGCADRPTRALLDLSIEAGAPAPTQLVVTVFDPYRAIADRRAVTTSAPTLPGLVIVSLPARDQEVRLLVDGGPVTGTARVAARAGSDQRAAVVLRAGLPDADADGIPDAIDDCPDVANPAQIDTDGDGFGDACRAPVVDGGTDGGDMMMGPPIRIWALHPAVAAAGATITIEGRFGAIGSANVRFPGGVTVPATLVGSGRVRATVPPGATIGPLTVEGDGAISNALPFRRTRYAPQVQSFRPHYEQETHGRSMPNLVIGRAGNVATVAGDFVYVAGDLLDTRVEAARLWADGTVGTFSVAARLSHTRRLPSSVALGTRLYFIGGFRNDAGTEVADIDATTINPDGTLAPINALSNVRLNDARSGMTAEIIGPWLYVIGGAQGTTKLATVERAPIADDGTLGPFERITPQLAVAREGHGSAVIGDALYVFAGIGGSYVSTVERAPILGDGSLGAFADVPALELSSTRIRGATVVTSDGVFHIGGFSAGNTLGDILRARIKPNGDLDAFAVSPATLSAPRTEHAAFVAGNRVYVVGNGGADGTTLEQASLIGPTTLNPTQFADAQTPLPAERARACVAVVNRALFVIGGEGAAGSGGSLPPTRTVFRAPIATDGTIGAFADAGVSLINPHEAAGCAIVGDKLHVIGGDGGGTVETAPLDEETSTLGSFAVASGVTVAADRYTSRALVAGSTLSLVAGDSRQVVRAPINPDNTLGAFAAVTDQLTVDRAASTVALLGSTVWALGGYDPAVQGFRATTEKATLDANSKVPGAWSAGPALARDRGNHAMVALGAQLLLIGGQYSTSIEAATISSSGASLGPFTVVTGDMPRERWDHEALILGNWLYLVGGAQTTANNTRLVDRAPIGN